MMTPQELLDAVPNGTLIKNWSDIIPLGHPDFWELPAVLETLARLDKKWRWLSPGEFYKTTKFEQVAFKAENLRLKWHLLWTEPALLDY